jgi:hypothetical protein
MVRPIHFLPVAVVFLLLATRLSAENYTTLDGQVYSGATLRLVEPDGLIISVEDGVVKLKFRNLPPEIRSKYGYNPAKESEYLRQRYDDDRKRFEQSQIPPPTPYLPSAGSPVVDGLSLDAKIRNASYNVAFVKNQIASLEAQLSQKCSKADLEILRRKLDVKKVELASKEALLNGLIAASHPSPSPSPGATATIVAATPQPEPPVAAPSPPSAGSPEITTALGFLRQYGKTIGWIAGAVVVLMIFLTSRG